jgi:hypothetical protein
MSRWDTFFWDDDTLWDSGAETENALAWGIEVDWDGDGVFDGANEAAQLKGFSSFRGRRMYLSTSTGFESIVTGRARIVLANRDGRYDAWTHPEVTDGREVRVRVCDLRTGVTYPIFYGVITNIEASNYQDAPTVVLTVEDGWRNLWRTSARVVMQENITVDTAIGLVLDAAKWPSRWGRNLDLSSDNISYFWSSGNIKAATELERLAQSFLGLFYIDATGKARYTTRTNTPSSVADFVQEELLKDMVLAQPWENRRNITRIKTHPLSSAATTLWELVGSVPSIESGTPLVLWGNYTYNNQPVSGKDVITPAATTDWTANTSSTGSGTDKTSEVTLTFYDLGDTAKMVFTYNGGGTIFLTSAKIRGDALYEVSVTDVTYPADTSSITDPREFILDLPWLQDVNAALDFSRVIGPFLAVAHPFPTVKVDGRPELQFVMDLFELVTATIDRVGIGGVAFRVAGIEHQSMGDNCQRVVSTYWLEPYIAGEVYWTWPVTNFGVDTIFAW